MEGGAEAVRFKAEKRGIQLQRWRRTVPRKRDPYGTVIKAEGWRKIGEQEFVQSSEG